MTLPQRTFGSTGITTTPIGSGGAVITYESEQAGISTVRAAVDAGVKYFDTSPGYGKGRSQPVFGEGLAGALDDVTVATKVGHFENFADHRRPAAIRAQIEQSLRYLQRDSVDVLQVHEANWSAWWEDGGSREQISVVRRMTLPEHPSCRSLRGLKPMGYAGTLASPVTSQTR